jgi:hypothetical protein
MKKLILVAFLLVGLTSFAQEREGKSERKERLSPEQKEAFLLKRLTKELDLNADQQVKVKAVIATESKKRQELMDARKAKRESGQKPTEQEKADMKKSLQTEQDAFDANLKGVLTSDQYTKWQKIKEDRKEKIREKMKERLEDKM